MKKTLLTALCLGCFGASALAQHDLNESKIWAFDRGLGIDFNTGNPVLVSTSLNSAEGFVEGTAAVSDANGQLLFYCSADSIWNRNHQLMVNSSGINPSLGHSTNQGIVIAPVITNPSQFYVFSLENYEALDNNPVGPLRLYYSIVDMTLDNGLGAVVAGQKGILIDSVLSEMMTIVAGDNCNLWLLVHSRLNSDFRVWEITASGISSTPVTSSVGNIAPMIPGFIGGYVVGGMTVSPDRRKIAIASQFGGFELFDFDPAFGTVSNAILLDTNASAYRACFSANSSMLYVKTGPAAVAKVSQYDLTGQSAAAIINSKFDYPQFRLPLTGGLKLGPDGKIYGFLQRANSNPAGLPDTLGVITNPEMIGSAAGYNPVAIPLGARLGAGFDLPNSYWKPLQDTLTSKIDTAFGVNNSLSLAIHGNYFTYQWDDNSTDSFKNVTAPGVYWVTYSNYCTYRTDTFNVVGWPASIGGLNSNSFGLVAYPNPAASTVTVELSGLNNRRGDIVLIDAVGKIVLKQRTEGAQTNLSVTDVATGIYTVEYRDDTNPALKIRTKLLINR